MAKAGQNMKIHALFVREEPDANNQIAGDHAGPVSR